MQSNHASVFEQPFRRIIQKDLFKDIKELSRVNNWRALCNVALDWIVILSAITLACVTASPLMYILAMIIVATRQHALLIIMHDASHYRLVRHKRFNDLLSDWLIAYPMLIRTDAYRKNHLLHHSHTNTDDDPDWTRKANDPRWEFPKTRLQIARILFLDLIGGGFIDSLRAIRSLGKSTKTSKESAFERVAPFAIAVTALAVSAYFGLAWQVFVLWYLPSLTILPVILRIRSIAEHFGLEHTHDLNASRNFHCGFVERALFAPHNVGYHLDHHLFPAVPFYNLPKLHARLMSHPEYAQHSHQSIGLFGQRQSTVEQEVTTSC